MKLVISIVQDDDALDLVDALNEKGYSVTKLAKLFYALYTKTS